MHLDPRSVLNGEARLRKLLSIRKALDEGVYYVESGELADALLQKAVLGGADANPEENARNTGRQVLTNLIN